MDQANDGASTAAPRQASQPSNSSQHYRTRFRRRRLLVLGVAVLAAAGVALAFVFRLGGRADDTPTLCKVSSDTTTYSLLPEQMINAATISTQAAKAGLSDHAVTVALATALQESKLRNLTSGDRDSLGLFQQRPSQGWGTPDQIVQPVYAATAFYQALAKVPNWETLDVAVAAQRVQKSADGSAYARWENEARTLAAALTGQKAAAVACGGSVVAYRNSAAEVAAATTTAVSPGALSAGVPTVTGWKAAAYLVANSSASGVTSVSYAGQTWTARRGTWQKDAKAGNQVTFTVPRPPSPAPNS